MSPNHRRSHHCKFPIGNVSSPPFFSILAPILLTSFNVSLPEKSRLATELATNFDENRSPNALAAEMATDENR
jgi:hypothetical protein